MKERLRFIQGPAPQRRRLLHSSADQRTAAVLFELVDDNVKLRTELKAIRTSLNVLERDVRELKQQATSKSNPVWQASITICCFCSRFNPLVHFTGSSHSIHPQSHLAERPLSGRAEK
jgi:hypothetical protein